MKGLYCYVIFSLLSAHLFAQTPTVGDYRSFSSGTWDNVNSWERFDGSSWVNPAPSAPSNTSNVITIQGGHTVTVSANANGDQITVTNGGILTINGGITFTVWTGAGDDLTVQAGGEINILSTGTLTIRNAVSPPPPAVALIRVYGQINNAGTISNASATTLIFEAGAMYDHRFTTSQGIIPIASWNSASTCKVSGYTSNSTAPSGLGQTFGNFLWDTPSLANFIDLNGALTTVNGNLTFQNNTIQYVYLTSLSNYTLNVGGNFTVSNALIGFNSTAPAVSINVGGNVLFLNNPDLNPTFDGDVSLDIQGNLEFSSGTTNLTYGGAGSILITLAGNFALSSSPVINNGGTGTYRLTFDGSDFQTYTASQAFTDFGYVVQNGSKVQVGSGSFFAGDGSLTLQGGATLGVGSQNGLATGTTVGNVRVTGSRTYQANSNIIYNASVSQNLGNEWGSTGALSGVAVNLEIANTSTTGVTNNIIGSTSLVGSLTLTTGSLNIGNSNTLQIQNNFIRTGGTIGGDATSNLTFSGSGTLNTLVFTPGMEFVNNLTVSRATELVLGSNATVSGAINLSGGNLNFSGRTLTMNGGSISTNGTGLRSNASSNLILGGATFAGAIPFSGTGNQLNKVTFGTNGGSYTWNSPVIVNDSVKLILGALTHSSGLTMANNSDFIKGGGTIGGVSPVVAGTDRYNVTYTGAGATGVELPTSDSDALNNLIVSSSGTITLSSAIKVNGDLSLTGGTFDANSNAIEIVDDFIANSTSDLTLTTVTFSGPATEITGSSVLFDNLTVTGTVAVNVGGAGWRINGNLVNNGSLSVTSGTITFGGTTSITGSSICAFRTMRIAGTLNAPTQMNVGVAFIYESGTFNANGGTVNFTGSPSTTVSNVASVTFHHILVTGGLTSAPNLYLTGNFTDNGTFTHNSGNVRFTGTSTQLIGGTSVTDFNDITVTNAAGPPSVQVVSDKNLRGVLTLSAGTNFDPDGPAGSVIFTLRSTGDVFSSGVTNDAAIAALPAGAIVNGNVNVQRYMALEGANNNRVYRYISSPVSNAPVSQLTDDFKISGTFTGANQAGSQSMFGYNETVITDQNGNGLDINDGFFDFPASNVTETMENGRGYAIFVYGNETPYTGNGNALWDIRGTINSGEVIFNATLTSSSNPSSDGWNLVGNPYPSTIDWDAASGWTKTGIANAIYMRDNGQTSPVYASYVNGAGTNGGSRYIPIGQAFQVRATGSPVNFRATEAVKVGGQQATYFREIPQQIIRIALNNGTVQDEMIVRFTDAATDGFDAEWDAYKLPNYRLNLSSITGANEKFAINSLPGLTCGKTIKLSMTDVPAGTYSLNFTEFESISMEMGIQLFDSYKSTTINVREEANYSFDVTEDVNSFGNNRFELRFITKEVPDFNAIADDVCESSQAFVNITNSEQGVRYRIMKNGTSLTEWQVGTGSALSLQLQTAQLTSGENLLSIQASIEECESVFLDKPLEIKVVPLTQVGKIDNGSSCGPGKVVVSAEGALDGNYKWYETESDQAAISGAVNGIFTTPELNKTKTYYVSTINDLGCESARKPVLAEIIMVDPLSITIDNETNILTSSYNTGNQWFFNGEKIPGATGQSIEVTETGLYEVEASVNSCSTRASQEMIVLGSEGGKANGISFYPNPVGDILYIELPDARPAKGEISSSAGHPLGSIDFDNGKAEFNFSGHAAGLYLVKVTQGNSVVNYKIIKK